MALSSFPPILPAGVTKAKRQGMSDGCPAGALAGRAAHETIRAKLADLALIAHSRKPAFSRVKIGAGAGFAGTISQRGQSLRREHGRDLRKRIGDLAADRTAGVLAAGDAVPAAQCKLAGDMPKYLLAGHPLLVRSLATGDFAVDAATLCGDAERLVKRAEKLESRGQ
ncbi:MAG TPA: sterol-binding protein [Burkholderiaceae bacterium]|jgi:ubiquinone biosynthesis protein UbiJ|nr:sterol-binding protein [Burkholderiaceae bacterium]